MDFKDVSDVDDLVKLLKGVQKNAEKAKAMKGEKVREHPHPQSVIMGFLMQLRMSTPMSQERNMISTSQVPVPYAACAKEADELKPMMISDMRLETHHRGKKVLLRVCTPPQRITAVMAIVEDEEGTALLLQLYSQPEAEDVPEQEIIQPGQVCIVKEPFFKRATSDHSLSLRVDHLGDLVWLAKEDERVPSAWKSGIPAVTGSSTRIRMEGNEAVQGEKWAEALRLYSSAIEVATMPEEKQLAHLNRSLANLRLGRPEKALQDAQKGSNDESPSEKRVFREARALYELSDFTKCHEKLQTLTSEFPKNTAAKPEMERCAARLLEQDTGNYDFRRMYKQAKATPPLVDCATFSGVVEIRPSPGRGNGLFTTKPVVAGQLLLCEKAFSYSYSDDDGPRKVHRVLMNLETKRMSMGGQSYLVNQIVQKLYHNPCTLGAFKDLHNGTYSVPAKSEADGNPVVDSFMVVNAISLNGFGAPRTSRQTVFEHMSLSETAKPSSHTTCGLWLLASRINHSCVKNCSRSFIGDMQIIRATKDMAEGTELSFWYAVPDALESYADTQKRLSNWGFKCTCEVCEDKKTTSPQTVQKRKVLRADLVRSLNDWTLKPSQKSKMSKIESTLKQLEDTYKRPAARVPRLAIWEAYFSLGSLYVTNNKPTDAIKVIVKGLQALGFDIIASPPVGEAKPPLLEVKRWGMVTTMTPQAFYHMFQAYESFLPELCPFAKSYARTAYQMVVGEAETASEQFRGLGK